MKLANMLQFEVIGKVPAKASRYRIGKHGFYVDSTVKQYEKDFALQVGKVRKNSFNQRDRLIVIINWHTDSRRQDIDSPAKIILDCLQKTKIIINDNKIDELVVSRWVDKNPRVFIEIIKEYTKKESV